MPRSLAPVSLSLAVAMLMAACATPAPQTTAPSAAAKQVITRSDQLPRTSVLLPVAPSALFTLPSDELAPILQTIAAELNDELARFDISDRSTLDGYSSARLSLAMLRGEWAAVPAVVADWRARQDKPAQSGTVAMLSSAAAAARAAGGTVQAQRTRFGQHLAAHLATLRWEDVGNVVRAQKGGLEINNPVVTVAAVRTRLDVTARNNGMRLDRGSVAGVLSQRVFIDHVLPFREQAVAVLNDYITRNDKPIADTWTPRTFALRPDAPGQPVVIAVWDSGVDPSLFRMAAPVPGIAFDLEARPEPELLQPVQRVPGFSWDAVKGFMHGSRDVQANIDSAAASAYRRHMAALQADAAQPFQESMRLGGNYYHGTHVAGIAVDGNPFARVFSARITFAWQTEPLLTTEERRERGKLAVRQTVAAIRAAGARVVNMSWGGSQRGIESSMQFHGLGKDGEERRALARRYFQESRDNLRDAMAAAPEILFITTSGNSNADAGFDEVSPADIQLPNLMTIGAVDSAGHETTFSSFGRTTVAHANGFRVQSLIPGGDKLEASGTSMAAPQVANLAAKLWALYPDLSVAQVRQLILDGAERNGRVNLVHPRRTLELAAALKPAGPRPAEVMATR